MATHNFHTVFVLTGLCLSFALLIGAKSPCDCPGPIKYYEEIRCTPVFKNEGDCCPKRYNCDHLKNLPNDKCVLYGHQYDIGQVIKAEDSRPCDVNCICKLSKQGVPKFHCPAANCPVLLPRADNCYLLQNGTDCCPSRKVCLEKEEDIPICMADGRIYRAGDWFTPVAEPEKSCMCSPEYTGENVKPYCFTYHKNQCGTMLRKIEKIRSGCIPLFHEWGRRGSICSWYYRCPHRDDAVIINANETKSANSESADPDMECKFGNLTMRVGDKLNDAADLSIQKCMKCVCEVPPIPTCLHFPTAECDVSSIHISAPMP